MKQVVAKLVQNLTWTIAWPPETCLLPFQKCRDSHLGEQGMCKEAAEEQGTEQVPGSRRFTKGTGSSNKQFQLPNTKLSHQSSDDGVGGGGDPGYNKPKADMVCDILLQPDFSVSELDPVFDCEDPSTFTTVSDFAKCMRAKQLLQLDQASSGDVVLASVLETFFKACKGCLDPTTAAMSWPQPDIIHHQVNESTENKAEARGSPFTIKVCQEAKRLPKQILLEYLPVMPSTARCKTFMSGAGGDLWPLLAEIYFPVDKASRELWTSRSGGARRQLQNQRGMRLFAFALECMIVDSELDCTKVFREFRKLPKNERELRLLWHLSRRWDAPMYVYETTWLARRNTTNRTAEPLARMVHYCDPAHPAPFFNLLPNEIAPKFTVDRIATFCCSTRLWHPSGTGCTS